MELANVRVQKAELAWVSFLCKRREGRRDPRGKQGFGRQGGFLLLVLTLPLG